MTPAPGPEFADRLADLDRPDFVALVAAVYEGRGWSVEAAPDGAADLLATPPAADDPTRIAVHHGDDVPTTGADADLTVTAARDDAVDADAADLREMVVYALDPADRDALCLRFFDCDPEAFAGDDEAGSDANAADAANEANATDDANAADAAAAPEPTPASTPATDPTPDDGPEPPADGVAPPADGADRDAADRLPASRTVALGLAILLLGLGGGVSAASVAGPPLLADAPNASAGTGTPPATATESPAPAGFVPPSARTVDPPAEALPPGVDADGDVNARRLADAHGRALAQRSFHVRVVHREYVDGRPRAVGRERIAVEASGRYRSRLRTVGTLEHEELVLADGPAYGNETARYVLPLGGRDVPESAAYRSSMVELAPDDDRIVDRTQRYVRWYLGVEESRIVGVAERDGTTQFWVAFDGDPWPGATETRGMARIDEDGLVREIRRVYVPPGDPSVRVEVTVTVTPGPVTVTTPPWLTPGGRSDTGTERNETWVLWPATVLPAATAERGGVPA